MVTPPSPPLEEAVFAIPTDLLKLNGRSLEYPKPKVVRRWISVLQNLERLEEDTAEEFVGDVAKLRDFPVGAAELVCRWAIYDRMAALDAARRVVNGELTVEKLRREEKDARQSNAGRVVGRQYAYRLRRLAESWALSQLEGFEPVAERTFYDPPGDLLFKREDKQSYASVLIHGPYKNVVEYEIRRISFLGLLVGAAACVERAIALVPYPSPEYWSWLNRQKVMSSNIEIFAVHYEKREFKPIKLERTAGAV
jgi:hypothetical protein